MSPDDPRHGSRAGYLAHRKADQAPCRACLKGRGREDKQVRFDLARGVRMEYTAAEIAALLDPWLTLGLSHGAIGNAAGMATHHGSRLGARVAAGHTFRRGTYLALRQVTEASFFPRAHVHADLTRTRIFSLMAAGHTLQSMPILDTGAWRHRDNITIDQARAVRDHYAATQQQPGTNAITRSRALNAGHQPPPAWDDPGTVAWPLGWTMPLPDHGAYDDVVVERILNGDWHLTATSVERREVAARWHAAGRSLSQLQRLTGWKPERYFKVREAAA